MATAVSERVVAPAPPKKGEQGISWWALAWIAPAVILLLIFFIYSLGQTIWWSFQNADSTRLTVGLGLIVAVLVDRVKIESVIKSTLFIPMAISFVGASIIWRFVYDFAPAGQTQIGLLNAILGLFGVPPQSWLTNPAFDNFALIAIYVWMWTGFSMVILSAALKGIPDDVIEAARIDGASRWTMFWQVTIPLISPTLGVVTT